MEIVFLGTAAPGGWAAPGCACRSCLAPPQHHRAPLATVPAELPPDVVLLDVATLPERLAELRRAGLDGSVHVVAVGLDHRVRSLDELERRLALWGARAVPDGFVLDTRAPSAARPMPRRTLVLGGSRSGKSAEAELRLAAEPYVTYVATGPSGDDDPEWAARVAAHRERRPAHWRTVESTDLAEVIAGAETPLLIDGIGTWVSTVQWLDPGGFESRCDDLVEAWRQAPAPVVAVSDEVGMGVVPATTSGRRFRDALGRVNQRLAAESEEVCLVVAGRVTRL
ncbi:bifunctional adenosylcobinamide kinase/adenosylcobinamide-phosphate guanylyltransferase [Nonomuraea soli]|uniref:Adenosylcobinamide kinase n=1 Tax=Nonomuraea soli TaxID=1032476 RepID=A0A7W0HNE0_9ACTN|nr:bifunctional adenosylcobinamide kinase/adenosylcobinamide-phosphate guanylyltransferase [Nonomuraea soli]MBA2889436.1 adenosylcobinamide kinase/adenosylcobinamide-phosphate guanylyltransferase [Nonomuraea soli]